MKEIFKVLLLLFLSQIAFSQTKGLENTPGKLKIWNNNILSAHNSTYPGETISGIENLVTLNSASYFSYAKIHGIKNSISGGSGSIGIYSSAKAYNPIGIKGDAIGYYGIGVYGISHGETYTEPGTYTGLNGEAIGNGGASTYTGVNGTATYFTGGSADGIYRGVFGEASGGTNSFNYGIYGTTGTINNNSFAGYFEGKVHVNGTLSKSAGTFKIDHPLDPKNKYLSHSFVESPDMMNIYNGNITTDQNGKAEVTLPNYFEALNIDFRYQLTAIGSFAQAIVLEEIKGNQFIIATDKPNTKVSWQVTGVRNDVYAIQNRIIPEEDKPINEKGKYLNADAFGLTIKESLHAVKLDEPIKK